MTTVEAAGLGLLTRRGWVFRDVDLELPAGSVAAVAGPAGSGRSMLLLTLAGRARRSAGSLRVGAAVRLRDIRRLVAVARVTGAVELDPDLLVADCRREARLLAPEADLPWAEKLVGLAVDGTDVVGELAVDDAALLALALAAASRPAVLVLDDVDRQATVPQQRRIWAALAAVADSGTTVIASTVGAIVAAAAGAHVYPIREERAHAAD